MTYGEKAVGLTFNPSADPKVQKIKELYAEIIDIIAPDSHTVVDERGSLHAEAVRQAQTAQMWTVKAVTWRA